MINKILIAGDGMEQEARKAKRAAITQEELTEQVFESVPDMQSQQIANHGDPNMGFYEGHNVNTSLGLGLSEEGRAIFQKSVREAIQRLFPDMRNNSSDC